MKLDAVIVYEEEYLPSKRHRIPRKRQVKEVVQTELKEKSKAAEKGIAGVSERSGEKRHRRNPVQCTGAIHR